MTNRDKLFMELQAMNDEQLGYTLDTMNLTGETFTDMVCADCPNNAGDGITCKCPHDEDGDLDADKCPTVGMWLGWPCRRERIFREVKA